MAWRRGTAATDPPTARRWLERARRLAPDDAGVTLSLALACLQDGDPAAAAALFAAIATRYDVAEAWLGLAASALQTRDADGAGAAMGALLSRHVASSAARQLAAVTAAACGAPGWCAMAGPGRVCADAPATLLLDGKALRPRWKDGAARVPPGRSLAVLRDGKPLLGSPIDLAAITAVEGLVEAHAGGLSGWIWHPADPVRDPTLTITGITRAGPASTGPGSAIPTSTVPTITGPASAGPHGSGLTSIRLTSIRLTSTGLTSTGFTGTGPTGTGFLSTGPTSIGTKPLRLTLRHLADGVDGLRPLARPRRFSVAASELPAGMLWVTGADGRDLLGSPINPALEGRSAAGLATGFQPVWADLKGASPVATLSSGPVDVVVPVHGRRAETLACLHSVLATLPSSSRLHVVDDASPDAELVAALQALAAAGRIRLLRQDRRGFPAAANAGMAAAAGRDVVLLNSDTLTPPGWLQALAAAARSAPDIGTACPLSNEATILSYPNRNGGNPMPDPAAAAALAAQANGAGVVDIPVAVGFCMFIRHACLDAVGPFREDLFAQGYGEENDFCLRARHRGWRHVAATGAFVAHHGGVSFGTARQHLQRRNAAVLERLHPGHDALIAGWIAADPLGPARLRMDALRWRAGRQASSVVLLTHAGGGGVDAVVGARCAALRAEGIRPVVLRPDGDAAVVGDGGTPNLRVRLPGALPALVRLLRGGHPRHVEFHHMLGHHPVLFGLPAALGVPHEVHVHDYAWFCPRIALVPEHSYCGEPPVAVCEACIADHGSNLEEPIGVTALVARSAAVLGGARRVVAPASDVAQRLRRHFPAVTPEVQPWGDDAAIPSPAAPDFAALGSRAPGLPALTPWALSLAALSSVAQGSGVLAFAAPAPAAPSLAAPSLKAPSLAALGFAAPDAVRRVCVIGGIGVEKGYEVLLACVRDAARRRLPLGFSLVGHSLDDERLMDAGPITVTGPYEPAEADVLIRAQGADLAFLPSIWPETWCFTLSHAWRAGLWAAVFDLGAPAERVRRTGWGWVLPLALPPPAVNDWFLRAAAQHGPTRRPSQTRRNAAI